MRAHEAQKSLRRLASSGQISSRRKRTVSSNVLVFENRRAGQNRSFVGLSHVQVGEMD